MSDNLYVEEAGKAYPTNTEVDQWVSALLHESEKVKVSGERLRENNITTAFGNGPNTLVNSYIKFTCSDERTPFYGYWQPAVSQPAPLLINLPGYGSCISVHPQINDLGYNILHISPQGYVTPQGETEQLKQPDGFWPVLANTARGCKGGYRDWLSDCLLAIRWANGQQEVLPNRISFFGTSQGGGASILLASILQQNVRCACADLPFLTNFPMSELKGEAYSLLAPVYAEINHDVFWHNLGFVDTLSHAHRLNVPVMLSSGGLDTTCPSATVESLFEHLICTKQYTKLNDVHHTHSRESMYLFSAWLRLFT